MSATLVFDPEPLSDLGDPETERELIDLFLAQAVDRLSRLERAIDASEPAVVYELAHELKGASATVGAIVVSALCQRLCQLTRASTGRGFAPASSLRAPITEFDPELDPASRARDAREVHAELVRALGVTGATMRRYTAGLAA